VPIAGVVRNLDPALCETQEQSGGARAFETLTRALDGTRVVPWIASEVLTESDGRRYRFRLRPGVRFHDGRRLTAHDVRHSWERLFLTPGVNRWLLSPIRGARRIIDGATTDLEELHTSSRRRSSSSTSKARRLLSSRHRYTPRHPAGGTGAIGATAEKESSGPGLRIASFEPGRRLGSSPARPTGGGLSALRRDHLPLRRFPEEIRNEFLAEVLLASDLLPADAEAFGTTPVRFRYRENPRS
jgi:hypothetical protein